MSSCVLHSPGNATRNTSLVGEESANAVHLTPYVKPAVACSAPKKALATRLPFSPVNCQRKLNFGEDL